MNFTTQMVKQRFVSNNLNYEQKEAGKKTILNNLKISNFLQANMRTFKQYILMQDIR